METFNKISERLAAIGLANDPKYQFLLGPCGLPITASDVNELERIGRAAAVFIRRVRSWYDAEADKKGGSRLAALLENGVPRDYLNLSTPGTMPLTMMIDTVWTENGWRIVEIDVTNRNAMGYPLIMRHLYNLPSIWRGIDQAWNEAGWSGVTQIMADQHRFYEPYFRFLLKQIGGKLLTEADLKEWMSIVGEDETTRLLDLPILYHSKEAMSSLLALTRLRPVAIPPVHMFSSKAVLALPWEVDAFAGDTITEFVPETHFLSRSFMPPEKPFFVKLLQSGGAHGTFENDRVQLARFMQERKPQTIWQEALPLARREITTLTADDQLNVEKRYTRISLFVTENGEVVDADVTASMNTIVHGGKQSVMTVPVSI